MNIYLYLIAPALCILNTYTRCTNGIRRFKRSFDNAFNMLVSDDIYLFLNDSVFPHDFKKYTQISVRPALMYNMTTNTFYPWNSLLSNHGVFHIGTKLSIPILSLEITDTSGNFLHDLTDFIESMKYIMLSSTYVKPTIGHIISVWQLNSKIILDESTTLAQYINTNGDQLRTSIRNLSDLY